METDNSPKLTNATRLARQLRSALREHFESDQAYGGEPTGDGDWRQLPDPSRLDPVSPVPHIEIIVRELDGTLQQARSKPRISEAKLPPDEVWTFGSVIRKFPVRFIHAGFVEPLHRAPVVTRIPEIVVAFLLSIPGEKDILKRERHNQVGWHYHYLDHKKRRSNVVLCWDTQTAPAKGKEHPLYQEYHGDGRADFPARPDLWGRTKKQSMHRACAPDLGRWPISEFRCASRKAGIVWPPQA